MWCEQECRSHIDIPVLLAWELRLGEEERFARFTPTVVCDKVHAQITVFLLMFYSTDSYFNKRDMHQYYPIIISVEFKISSYQTLICA